MAKIASRLNIGYRLVETYLAVVKEHESSATAADGSHRSRLPPALASPTCHVTQTWIRTLQVMERQLLCDEKTLVGGG
jgi:hypothetical protein